MSIRRSLHRGARLASLAAVVSLATLAACGDSPSAPRAESPAPAPTAAVAPPPGATGPQVMVRTVDSSGIAPVGGATVRIRRGSDSLDVADNSAADLDGRKGFVLVQWGPLAPELAVWSACVMVPPTTYNTPFGEECKAGNTYVGGQVWITPIVVYEKPQLSLTFTNLSGTLVSGGQATVTGPNGVSMTVSGGWTSPLLPYPGAYTVCESKAPDGYHFTDPMCRGFQVQWGGYQQVQLAHARRPKTGPIK